MRIIADLHVHSRFSRATSKRLDFVALHRGALEKGITLVGTGDFTHPGWMSEIEAQLIPAEEGLFRLRDDLAAEAERGLPSACGGAVRFMLQVEISNIYKKADRTRKNHNLVFVPHLEAAKRFTEALSAVGNLASDGRPILGLDARDLLEITLETAPGAFLVPAHIWTPWFSMLGSKSGFDSLESCFDDLASEVFAVETGLSSDPPMNWRVETLDRLTLISNSDAHSPAKLGREANLLDCELSYEGVHRALRTGRGFEGTIEFFPEEGKYHLDGHRKCGLCLSPAETLRLDGRCPVCGGLLTVGVMSRVRELAAPNRPEGYAPAGRAPFESLVPLPEVLGEVLGVGPGSRRVLALHQRVIGALGPELHVLMDAPLEDIGRVGGAPLAEAVRRIRTREMAIAAGYDGEFGKVMVFTEAERADLRGQTGFFGLRGFEARPGPPAPTVAGGGDTAAAVGKPRRRQGVAAGQSPARSDTDPGDTDPLSGLNPAQRRVAECGLGPLVVVAGPGTGKTRTLVSRIAHLVSAKGLSPSQALAISFTNQAATELRERLDALRGADEGDGRPMVCTFHGLGRFILETLAGGRVTIADEARQEARITEALGPCASAAEVQAARQAIGLAKQRPDPPARLDDPPLRSVYDRYEALMQAAGEMDLDDLVLKAYRYLDAEPSAVALLRDRFRSISVDEYQDINDVQAALIKRIAGDGEGLLVIGDPDQAIYGFRGAEPGHFTRFAAAYPSARQVTLATTYRLTEPVLATAHHVLGAPRSLGAVKGGPRVEILACPTPESEAEQLLVQLESLVGASSHFAVDTGRGGYEDHGDIGFGDIAVLTRIKRQRETVLAALDRSGIPCRRVGEDDPHDPRAQKVAVMTMHAAKGREFEVVFIVGVEPGLMPLALPGLTTDAAEERRLLFVAVTRAKRRVYISYAMRRRLLGREMPGGPSPFIADLPGDAAVRKTATWRSAPEKKQLSLF